MEVGTSGFMTSQSQWLKLGMLNCIEVNSSFYRLPTEKTIQRLAAFPDRVSFIFKVSKYITHIKRLKDVEEAWGRFWDSVKPLAPRMITVLFQLPPSFHNKPENVDRIIALKKYLPSGVTPAFEFRDKSWIDDSTYALFRKLKWCIVGTMIGKQEGTRWMGSMPGGLFLPPKTCDMTYVRVHGRKGFRGSMSDSALLNLKKQILSRLTFMNVCMFNNVFFDRRGTSCEFAGEKVKYAAVCNACQFASTR
jgi:uncharacterized protein YecE (DUF72 family)